VRSSKRTLHQTINHNDFSQKKIMKENMLKETNHTLTEDVSDDEEKATSFPNLDFCSQENGNEGCKRPKHTLKNLKQDK
jgi:hypothetical protein